MSRLQVKLGRLSLKNPILVASGTFGYAREMQAYVDCSTLGGIIPKTVTLTPRAGNAPPRTIETASGLLNSIGLDNDGLDVFLAKHREYLASLGTAVIVNIAGKSEDEFHSMATRLGQCEGIAALELNISCPNVSGGVDYGTNPALAASVVTAVRSACELPVIAKLTPNVTSVPDIAAAVEGAGADAVSLINTLQGLVIDWRKRRPILGGNFGGLSGPAIKPVALRIVAQVRKAVDIPIIGVGGIASLTDVLDFLVAGASAVQIGTASFYDPGLAQRLVTELEQTLTDENIADVADLVGTLELNPPPA